MKPLYSPEQFDSSKSRDLLQLECEHCHQPFSAAKKDIQWALKCSTRNYLRLCSKTCRALNNDKRVTIPCKQCNKNIKRMQCELKKNKYQFCSGSCSATYWNQHKTWGSNRSKLEKWIEEQFANLYPNLEIHYNRTDAINAKLDIYIPSLKLAFELNGIFYYEPIFGKDRLDKTQTNDGRKFQACLEKKIELCVIDTSSVKYFKHQNVIPFLNIITKIINLKMADSTGVDPDTH